MAFGKTAEQKVAEENQKALERVWGTNNTNISQNRTETHAGTLAAIEAIG